MGSGSRLRKPFKDHLGVQRRTASSVIERVNPSTEPLEVARGAARPAAIAASTLPAESHLDLPEGGFGAQQILQRPLLRT